MDLRDQRCFVVLAEELHFGRAAGKLGISQPALSRRMRDLESELKVPLLWRKDGVRLTPAGTTFLRRARETLSQVDRTIREVQGVGRGDLGSIEIGFMSSAGARLVPRTVRAFRRRHPRVEVRLRLIVPPLALDLVRGSQIDFAFVPAPVDAEDLAVEEICRESFVLACPSDHPLARRASVPPSALHRVPLVYYPRHLNTEIFDQTMAVLREAGATANIVLEAFPAQAMLSAVAAGIGVTLLPEGMQDFRQKGVVYRRLKGRLPSIRWMMACRRGKLDAAQDAFIKVVRSLRRGPNG